MTRVAESAAGSVLGSAEQLVSRIAAEVAQAVVAQIDVDAILAQIDVDALIRRVDVNAIVERVDVNALMGRVDVDAILERVDLGPVVDRVLDEVDIGAIVMESTGSITGGVVDSVRVQTIVADSLVERVANLVLLRRLRRRREGSK